MSNRTWLVVAIVCGWLAYSDGWLPLSDDWRFVRTLEPQEIAAVELQCRGMDGEMRATCEEETSESLVSGDFDPESILRPHCTRFENHWAEDVEIPPTLCIERYGGWLHG